MRNKIIIETTSDGSHTLFLPELGEHYHSVNGAIQEAKHVYIESAFNQCKKTEIHVLEIGFGTGLNALLTFFEARKRNIKVVYIGLEKYPLPEEIIFQLNYSVENNEVFRQIHSVKWGELIALTPFFSLQKVQVDFNEYDFPGKYDVIYYDAFAPDKQNEVWTQNLFNQIYATTDSGGILSTYCAKGEIRRRMQTAGFKVNRLPGPPGKREMLQAVK